MPTYKELLLSKSTLPQVGIYTLGDHLASSDIALTATAIGDIVVQPKTYDLVIETSESSLAIDALTFTLSLTPSILYPVVTVQKQLDIVISQDC